jgi:hypothetical protein
MILKKGIIGLCIASLFLIGGCGQKEYYSAMQAQNVTIQKLNNRQIEIETARDNKHEEHMLLLINNSMNACAKTPDKTDDVLVPMLIMNMENQWMLGKVLASKNGTHTMQLQTIKAPETFGEAVKNSTGAILGIGAIWAGIHQSDNLADVAVAGMASAGVHNTVNGHNNALTSDSYKSASQNTTTGNNNSTTAGDMAINSPTDNCADGNCEEEGGSAGTQGEASTGVDQCLQNPPAGNVNGTSLYSPGCSCKSHFIDKRC